MRLGARKGYVFILKLLAVGVLVAGCQSVQNTAQKIVERDGDQAKLISRLQPDYVPSKLAVGLERDLMNKRADSYGLISVPEMSDHLNGIRDRLLRASGVGNVPGRVYVSADPMLNAMTTPDGNIFVNWNLLHYLASEDDVAAVIAHELAHNLLGHADSTIYGQYVQKTRWLHRFGLEIVVNMRDSAENGHQKGVKKGEVSQLHNLQLATMFATKVVSPSWQRTQERAADLLGVDLLVAAGYNPDGMLNVLSVLKQYEDNNRKGPDWNKLGNSLLAVAKGDNRMKLYGGISAMEMVWGHDHPDAETRTADVQAYLSRHYDDSELSSSYQKTNWDRVRRHASFRKLLVAYEGALTAHKLLESGQAEAAYKKSSATIGTARNHAYPAFIYAMSLDSVGKYKEAQVALKQALDPAQEGSGKVYDKLASIMAGNGRPKDAWQLMNSGYERFGKAPQMVPGMVRYQRMSGDRQRAGETARMCALNYPDYSDYCMDEANRT